MAVTSVKEIHDGRDGEEEAGDHGSSKRTYTRVFRVTTDSNMDEAVTVTQGVGIALGDAYPTDPSARCRRFRARNESFSKKVWIVTYSYSTGPEIEEDPTNDPAEITWSGQVFEAEYYQDKWGDFICNSAGDYFDPPVKGDKPRWVVTVKKNMAVVPPWILLYQNAVNDAEFILDGVIIPPRCAKVSSIQIGPWEKRNDVAYRQVQLEIPLQAGRDVNIGSGDAPPGGSGASVRAGGWDAVILDAGLYQKSTCTGSGGGVGSGRKWCTHQGEPVKRPVCLDGNGCQLQDPSPSNAVYLIKYLYEEKDFSILPLT